MWFHKDATRKTVENLTQNNSDYTVRSIQCGGETITLLYIKQLTDRTALSNFIIRPIVDYCSAEKKPLKAEEALDTVLYVDDCSLQEDENRIENFVLDGMVVLLFSNDKSYLVANLKKVEHRPISTPALSYTMRAPRDSFVENLDVNLCLMRYRLKDRNLRVEYMETGVRTRLRIAVLYIHDIANDTAVQEIKKRVGAIDTDGVLASGELQSFLLNNRWTIFPQAMVVERSDMAAECLLEGKVLLMMDGSSLPLATPIAFVEYLYASDDRYEDKFFGMFMRLIRFAAFFISFSASSYWVALIAFHSDILPASFIISLAQARSKVPFNAVLGVLVLEFIVELIREALLRVPTKIGTAIAIVGALIIGQAAITAGVFSPLLLILVSVEFLASFAIPNQIAANPFRWIKFALLLVTGMFGFYGYILGLTVVVVEMVSTNNLGVPYVAPFGPLNLYDLARTFLFNRTVSKSRQHYMRDKDNRRSGGGT